MRSSLIYGVLFFFSSSLGYGQNFMNVTTERLFRPYLECQNEFNSVEIFESLSEKCMNEKKGLSLDQCDDIAESELEKIESRQEHRDRCEHLRPTSYAASDDPLKIKLVGSVGATGAYLDGKTKIAIKMFEECVAVGDLKCYYRLGQLKLYGDRVKKDYEEAVRLLEYAADNGYEPATKELIMLRSKNN